MFFNQFLKNEKTLTYILIFLNILFIGKYFLRFKKEFFYDSG